ncbi:MAG TPA: class I adenylate-forming enzyme family protein [Ilumatobacter sp.]|nr:class I adenylate-forming enzyme family protein [Ilumatobacter sp.]
MNDSNEMLRPHAAPDMAGYYSSRGWWGDETFRGVLKRHAATDPDGVAIIEGDQLLTWAEYDRRSDSAAAALVQHGLLPGDRVAVLAPDGPLVHVLFVAAEKAGLVVMAIGPRAGEREIAHLVRASQASTLVTAAGHRDDEFPGFVESMRRDLPHFRHHLVATDAGPVTIDGVAIAGVDGAGVDDAGVDGDELVALLDGRGPGPNELFLLNSTSGTTGLPKCVMHHQNRWFYFHQLAVESGGLRSDDVFMSVVPAPFGFGLWTSHVTPLLLGAPTVVLSHFSPKTMIAAIERHRVSVLAAVSTQFIMMLNEPSLGEHDLSSLRALFTGGEAVPRQRAAEFEEQTGARVLQFYGSNETGALSRTTLTDDANTRWETAGHVIDDMTVRLIDEAGNDVTSTGGPGQPVCLGPATCLGYYDDDEANRTLVRPDGWMTTGDIALLDGAGRLSIVGRTSDIIIRGGKNISAPAVEAEVLTHPMVALAAAVAVPDPTFGERVCVVVSSVDGHPLTLEDITDHLRQRGVTKEWWPEYFVLLPELPRASGGKIAKAELREMVKQRFATEGS